MGVLSDYNTQQNLILNGSFEDGTGTEADYWTLTLTDPTEYYEWGGRDDSGGGQSGTYYVYMYGTVANDGPDVFLTSTLEYAQENVNFTFIEGDIAFYTMIQAYWYGANTTGKFRVYAGTDLVYEETITSITNETDWTLKTADVSLITGTKTLKFQLYMNNPGDPTLWDETYVAIDNVIGLGWPPSAELTVSTPEVWSSVFIDTTPVFSVPFDGGSSEIIVGETVTGATSGATGTVTLVVVTGGTWGGGDAEGYILIESASGIFENNEEIDGSTSGNDAAEVDGDMSRITPKVIEKSCWKSIDEVYWQASLLLDGLYSFSDVAGFKELYIDMPDHTATSQRVFYGFIPNQGIVQNPGDNTTRLTAYSHAFNLANQFIPDEYRDTVEWVPSGASGYVTFSDPSVPITAFLGGALWNLTTGIRPQNILTITDWGTSDIPIRGFAWGPEVNKWQAIQEMADYCGYVFEVLYDSSQDCAVANFCAVDDIDTYIGTPAAVTFDKGDAAKYILNVSKERRGTEMINRVRVQGRRNKRILNFVDGVTEFTAGHTVLDGLTGAEATIISCTKTAGAWGGTAVGYLIISYDRTADFVHDSTIIDALGAAFGEATMQGNSVIYETYDEYTYYIESASVTNLDERPRERFFMLEEEYDSTPLIEAKCQAYYDMYALDPTPYNVTFRDRCDLRLWQKVKLTGFTEIPEDWMRIVEIRYLQRSGGAVEVQCTLNNADYVIAQRKMKRSLRNNDVTEIEKIVKALLAKKEVKVGEALKVQGEGITIELQDGEKVVVSRAPE